MSIVNFTVFASKCKLFFLPFTSCGFFCGWFIPWPPHMAYAAWQNLLKSALWFLGRNERNYPQKRQAKIRWKYTKRISGANEIQKEEIAQALAEIPTTTPATEGIIGEATNRQPLELVTMIKTFWERKHISQHIEEAIYDYRNPEFITYSKQSIIMSALMIFIFRMGSGNSYDIRGHDDDEKYSRANIAKFINAPEKRVPVIKTIEKFLKRLDEQSVNRLLSNFFKDLQRSKFFKQHPQIKVGDFFLLAADCVHTHTYDHPHHLDKYGNNDCEYCLKRVHNKGTKHEKVAWIHNTLVFSFIFMGGLKIPIYYYPIHAKQIVSLENASEDAYKQECELVALKTALPLIREIFPKMKIVLLLDGLYANKPVIQLAESCRCGYIIVRKEGCLSLLAKECDERAVTPNHKKNCVKNCQGLHKGWIIRQHYEWFNSMYLGENLSTNVLRFDETRTRGKETEFYKCEWLFSWRLSAKSCVNAARQARTRWEVEDLFNTLKNRDFDLKHDYSRDPLSYTQWQGLALFAFGIFELFRFSEVVRQRGEWPQKILADKLLGQLLYYSTEELFSQQRVSRRVQFRYNIVVDILSMKETSPNDPENWMKTG